MKNYEEIAESVFKRSEERIAENKRRRRERLINIGATVGCLAVAGAVGIGVWKTAGRSEDFIGGTDIYGANAAQNDTVTDHITNEIANSDNIVGVIPDLDPPDYPTLSGTSTAAASIPSPAASSTSESEPSLEPAGGSVINETPNDNNPFVVSTADSEPVSAVNPPDYDPPIVSSADEPYTPPNFITVVEEYGTPGTLPAAPQNGKFVFSDALKGAMEAYGYSDNNGDIQYHVVLSYYDNGTPVDANSSAIREAEWNRLCGHGYHCEFESCSREWGAVTDHHLCVRMTREQLESFTPCDSYGCTVCLYSEKDCIMYEDSNVNYVPTQTTGHHGSGHHSDGHC
ncbi:MAG: hypothetical protein HDT43_08125 [Ruminococcaceae bacterium]|nr:hypothetical protein [Oscillospiraceae bacterium]